MPIENHDDDTWSNQTYNNTSYQALNPEYSPSPLEKPTPYQYNASPGSTLDHKNQIIHGSSVWESVGISAFVRFLDFFPSPNSGFQSTASMKTVTEPKFKPNWFSPTFLFKTILFQIGSVLQQACNIYTFSIMGNFCLYTIQIVYLLSEKSEPFVSGVFEKSRMRNLLRYFNGDQLESNILSYVTLNLPFSGEKRFFGCLTSNLKLYKYTTKVTENSFYDRKGPFDIIDISNPLSFSFGHCATLSSAVYYIGVAQTILEKFVPPVIEREFGFKFLGTGFGAIVASCMALNMGQAGLEKLLEIFERLDQHVRDSCPGKTHKLYSFISEAQLRLELERFIPTEPILYSNKLLIGVTLLPTFENLIVKEFHTRNDIIDSIIASCTFPFIHGNIPVVIRLGDRTSESIGGLFSDTMPIYDALTISVSMVPGTANISPWSKYNFKTKSNGYAIVSSFPQANQRDYKKKKKTSGAIEIERFGYVNLNRGRCDAEEFIHKILYLNTDIQLGNFRIAARRYL